MPIELTQPHSVRSPRVLIVGGGVAALEAMLALRALAEERIDIALLAPERDFSYRPLAVTQPFGAGEVARFDIGDVARQAGASHLRDQLASVDLKRRRVHTAGDAELPYDALLLAVGARAVAPLEGALTFRGARDVERFRQLLGELEAGSVKRLVFALPAGQVWSLPLYELALHTAAHLERRAIADVEITLVTPEDAPLAIFGRAATTAIETRLKRAGIAVRARAYPAGLEGGRLRLVPGDALDADRVVTLAAARGPAIRGVPSDADGFLSTDGHGRVQGLGEVYAAGDATSFPLKQGGLAAQQADAAAESIAAAAGALVTPRPFKPVLRGLLLTGATPIYLRTEMTGGHGDHALADADPLWWPPAKIAAKYLGPFLAGQLATAPPLEPAPVDGEVRVAREFDRELGEWRDLQEPVPSPSAEALA